MGTEKWQRRRSLEFKSILSYTILSTSDITILNLCLFSCLIIKKIITCYRYYQISSYERLYNVCIYGFPFSCCNQGLSVLIIVYKVPTYPHIIVNYLETNFITI